MRHSTATRDTGRSRTSWFGARYAIYGLVVSAVVIWGGVAFAQEAYISHKLSQQVASLRNQNALIAAQNEAYRKDVKGITTGAASEEEARLSGYSRPNEHVYLVTVPANPSPSPSASTSPSASPRSH
jgi:cell division protein FtsB